MKISEILNQAHPPFKAFEKYNGVNIEKVPGIKQLNGKSFYNHLFYRLPDGLEFEAEYNDEDDSFVIYYDVSPERNVIGYSYRCYNFKFNATDDLRYV